MQGAAYEAVVVHCECAATQQMQQDRLAQRVKNADILFGISHRYEQTTKFSRELQSHLRLDSYKNKLNKYTL